MKIPSNAEEREEFYRELIRKCNVSREERTTQYAYLRSWYLFGNGPDEAPALYNKIFPHIDQLTSFVYSAETTRFSIELGASVSNVEHRKTPSASRALHDQWHNSNADQEFSNAVSWALAYNSCFIKVLPKRGNQIQPHVVEPSCIGVLREDTPGLDKQEAFTHSYYVTRSELYHQLFSHPRRDSIVERLQAQPHDRTTIANGIERIVMSQVNPTLYGNVNLDLSGTNRYKASVAEPTVEMTELWLWNDDTQDYQVVTMAEPDVIIYDRPGESLFLKGEHPFIQICPNPLYDYFWGASEVERLVYLQQLRNRRMTEILDLLSKQVNPPVALFGFSGIIDEKNFALTRAGGVLANDMPSGKVDKLAPDMPPDLFKEIAEIDMMFEEASGITSVLQGRGEAGVRSGGHANQLARLGSSRAKKRALVIEDALEKLATMYLKLMQVYDPTHYFDIEGEKFILDQFTKDFVVKVDAHSNSPIFMEDTRNLAFNLFKAGVIDKESLLDLLEPPMKQLLKERLKKLEQKQQQAQQAQQQQPQGKQPPKLEAVSSGSPGKVG